MGRCLASERAYLGSQTCVTAEVPGCGHQPIRIALCTGSGSRPAPGTSQGWRIRRHAAANHKDYGLSWLVRKRLTP
jgi:hypothetical protein